MEDSHAYYFLGKVPKNRTVLEWDFKIFESKFNKW